MIIIFAVTIFAFAYGNTVQYVHVGLATMPELLFAVCYCYIINVM